MLSRIQQALRQSPLTYGVLFAALPLMLGIALGPLIGFGPCGPNVPSSVRGLVVVAGTIAVAAPFIGAWLFSISFQARRAVTAVVGLPLLCGSLFVCCYWFFIIVSAVMG
jgi:hypothetical protein